jgi:hypothetical protein
MIASQAKGACTLLPCSPWPGPHALVSPSVPADFWPAAFMPDRTWKELQKQTL